MRRCIVKKRLFPLALYTAVANFVGREIVDDPPDYFSRIGATELPASAFNLAGGLTAVRGLGRLYMLSGATRRMPVPSDQSCELMDGGGNLFKCLATQWRK